MNNPANMLMNLFDNWRSEQKPNNIHNKRSNVSIAIQGGSLIKELSDFIESTSGTTPDLTFYLPELEKWAEVVGKVSTCQTIHSGEIDSAIFSLRTLAPHLDGMSSSSTEEDAASVSESVDELTRIITSDPTFPEDLKRYCFKIFEAVRHDLAMFETLNEFDLQESIDRLIATTNRLAAHYKASSTAWENVSKVWEKLLKIGTFSKGALEVADSGHSVLAAITQGS